MHWKDKIRCEKNGHRSRQGTTLERPWLSNSFSRSMAQELKTSQGMDPWILVIQLKMNCGITKKNIWPYCWYYVVYVPIYGIPLMSSMSVAIAIITMWFWYCLENSMKFATPSKELACYKIAKHILGWFFQDLDEKVKIYRKIPHPIKKKHGKNMVSCRLPLNSTQWYSFGPDPSSLEAPVHRRPATSPIHMSGARRIALLATHHSTYGDFHSHGGYPHSWMVYNL